MSEPKQYYASAPADPGREQEAALIGAILRRPALFTELRETIKADSFGFVAYRRAWEAMLTLAGNEQGIDVLTVGDELQRSNALADFSPHDLPDKTGRVALSYIRETGQPQNARDYATNVIDYAAKREINEIMMMGTTWAANGRRASDIMIDLEKRLEKVNTGSSISRNTVTLREALRKAVDRTARASRGEIQFIPSGFKTLDDIITGFSAPDFTLIAGRPGQGKTALLASIADNIIRQGKKIAFFTLEMASEQIATRFISMISGVSYQKQQKGELSFEEWTAYNDAVEKLDTNDLGLYLNDLPAISPNKIRQELRRLWPVDVVMIDFLQLTGADQRYEARHLEVGATAYALKNICKEFSVPIISAAQLSRESEKRNNGEKRPILSDLGESGKLEQAADKVIFIHRPTDNGLMAEIIISKQRNGPTGMCMLNYVGYKTKFESQPGLQRAVKAEL